MSELSITHGGIAISGAGTAELRPGMKSSNKKLNDMNVELIDVDLTTLAAAIAADEVISQSIEIANAVTEQGGTGIIQSIVLNSDDAETPAMDLVFSQVSDNISSAISATVGDDEDIDSIGAKVLGHVSLSNYTNLVDCVTATKLNIGLIVKAASTTRSIWVHAINRSGANFTPTATDDLHLRVGIAQD